jgi:hypothetical protein
MFALSSKSADQIRLFFYLRLKVSAIPPLASAPSPIRAIFPLAEMSTDSFTSDISKRELSLTAEEKSDSICLMKTVISEVTVSTAGETARKALCVNEGRDKESPKTVDDVLL